VQKDGVYLKKMKLVPFRVQKEYIIFYAIVFVLAERGKFLWRLINQLNNKNAGDSMSTTLQLPCIFCLKPFGRLV